MTEHLCALCFVPVADEDAVVNGNLRYHKNCALKGASTGLSSSMVRELQDKLTASHERVLELGRLLTDEKDKNRWLSARHGSVVETARYVHELWERGYIKVQSEEARQAMVRLGHEVDNHE